MLRFLSKFTQYVICFRIRINAEDIAKLKQRVNSLEGLRIEVVQLEEKEA